MRFLPFLLLFWAFNSTLACTPDPQPAYHPTAYYSSTQNLEGQALKSALNTLIKGHQTYSYSPCTWVMLEQADEDPTNANNVIGFYTRRAIAKSNRDQGGNTPNAWNREHIWPKSHGLSSKNQHAHNDGHHLRATDKSVNADRGSKDFAEGGTPHHECTGCSSTANTWEPPDEVKGDTARMMFYMAVRYEGNDNSGTGDLYLEDNLTSGGTEMGKLCDLMNWHLQDPVSAQEQQRNDVIYSWQGNRNPFIDHPHFAQSIWGPACGISTVLETEDNNIPLPLWSLVLLAVGVSAMVKAKA